MELIVKVDESKAKELIGFLKTLEFVEIKRYSGDKPTREPRFEYFGSDPNWQPDANELRKLSSRKKTEW